MQSRNLTKVCCFFVVDLGSLTLDAMDSVSDIDSQPESVVYDTLGPPAVPAAPAAAAWMTQYAAAGKQYTPSYMSPGIVPLTGHIPSAPYNFVNDAVSLDSLLIANGADTVQSSSGMSVASCYMFMCMYCVNFCITLIATAATTSRDVKVSGLETILSRSHSTGLGLMGGGLEVSYRSD